MRCNSATGNSILQCVIGSYKIFRYSPQPYSSRAAEMAKIKLTSYYQKTSDMYSRAVVLDSRLNVHFYALDDSPDAVPAPEKKKCFDGGI